MVDETSKGAPPRRREQERQEHEQVLGRRQFLTTACGAIAGGLVLTGATRPARAQGKFAGEKVVFASWGGIYQEASKKGYCDSLAAKT
jgi:predicted amidohydrolase